MPQDTRITTLTVPTARLESLQRALTYARAQNGLRWTNLSDRERGLAERIRRGDFPLGPALRDAKLEQAEMLDKMQGLELENEGLDALITQIAVLI